MVVAEFADEMVGVEEREEVEVCVVDSVLTMTLQDLLVMIQAAHHLIAQT